MSSTDPYAEWDAAYVIGALSPRERLEYEEHLSGCAACSQAVASLAGIPGILSTVPADRALRPPHADPSPAEVPTSLLPELMKSSRRARRWGRIRTAAVAIAAAVAGVMVSPLLPERQEAALPMQASPLLPEQQETALPMLQTIPSPVTAEVRVIQEPWGTRVELTCRYAVPADPAPPKTFEYALYVTDLMGSSTRLATWMASPDTTTMPVGTTGLTMKQIRSIDVRLTKNGRILLDRRL
ncbi:anti-sigma factor family protein [Nonomuraea guangzhouensis]|uniref:Anti-sigma factor family protein n=1 Tax=Nonomuraea guangzhouensis TaxID=1291555 RepID=A0ABW4G5E2_9ACTN|nr:zf-HC2 domain-containing protein [Nonomuraea guangzhouensis]